MHADTLVLTVSIAAVSSLGRICGPSDQLSSACDALRPSGICSTWLLRCEAARRSPINQAFAGAAQAAANYMELACPDVAETLIQAPDGLAVHRVLVSERDTVLARSLHAAAERAAAQGPTPGSGPRAPCIVGVVGCTHLPGVARQWPRAGVPDGGRSGYVPSASAAGGGARPIGAGVWGECSPADGASGRAPGSSQARAGQPHDRAAGSRASASSHSSCAERGETGAAAEISYTPPDAPGVTGAPGAEGSAAEHPGMAHSMAARAAKHARASPDECGDEGLGVRRALLERLIDLMALPEVAADLRAALPVLAPGAASAAHANALELYGAPRMLLACLTREQLALVRHQYCRGAQQGQPDLTYSLHALAFRNVSSIEWCPAVQLCDRACGCVVLKSSADGCANYHQSLLGPDCMPCRN